MKRYYIKPCTEVADLEGGKLCVGIISTSNANDSEVQIREEEDYGESFDFEW